MSKFMVNLTAANIKEEDRSTPPVEVMVDTGSELSWLPKQLLLNAGITARRKRSFATATNQIIEREVGYAMLCANGYTTVDEVVMAEETDLPLLGVRTIEGFGVVVDNIGHRFIAATALTV